MGGGSPARGLSLAGHPDPERFAPSSRAVSARWRTTCSPRCSSASPEVSRLLLRTSILERVSGPFADRLTGCSGSERILLELEDAGAFVVAVDAERSWFRYHHLFADLLALELRRTAPQEMPGLHTIAAEWLAEHGYPVEAIRHAQAAEKLGSRGAAARGQLVRLVLDGGSPPAASSCLGFPPTWSQRMPSWRCSPRPTGGRRGHCMRATRARPAERRRTRCRAIGHERFFAIVSSAVERPERHLRQQPFHDTPRTRISARRARVTRGDLPAWV